MKIFLIKAALFGIFICVLADDAMAQPTGRRNKNTGGAPRTDTSGQVNVQQNNNQPPQNYNPYANVPLEYGDTTTNASSAPRVSKRNENAFDKSSLTQRTPLEYENLRWDDALFAEKVWREIDLNEKVNKVFLYEASDNTGSQVFMDILLNAVNSGKLTAFSDERFTDSLGADQLQQMTEVKNDTTPVTSQDDPNKIVKYVITRTSFDSKSVMKFRIKEEWVFDRESSRMFCRILGICPIRNKFSSNGQLIGVAPMFWIYYPDLRPILASHEVYNPKNMGHNRMTWEELFEARMFSSYIVKSTLDNPSNSPIRTKIKDGILALLEGENIKEKLFNYEQDLWSY